MKEQKEETTEPISYKATFLWRKDDTICFQVGQYKLKLAYPKGVKFIKGKLYKLTQETPRQIKIEPWQ